MKLFMKLNNIYNQQSTINKLTITNQQLAISKNPKLILIKLLSSS